MTRIPSEERRKSPRLNGRKEALLIQSNGMHSIRDISLGGLSFRCPRDEMLGSQWPVEIILAGSLLFLIEVSVRLVREQVDSVVSLVALPSKDVGVEFVDLDEDNRTLLTRMLNCLQQNGRV